MPNFTERSLPPLSWLAMFFKGPAHLVYFITLNLNISASRQNIKNLISNFGAIHVRILLGKFQASSFTGVGGEWGDTWDVTYNPFTKFLNSPCASLWEGSFALWCSSIKWWMKVMNMDRMKLSFSGLKYFFSQILFHNSLITHCFNIYYRIALIKNEEVCLELIDQLKILFFILWLLYGKVPVPKHIYEIISELLLLLNWGDPEC